MLPWKRKDNKSKTPGWQESIAHGILNSYRAVQRLWVTSMEQLTGRLSVKKQKAGFIMLVISGSFYCGHIIYTGIKKRNITSIKIDSIHTGKHLGQTGEEEHMKTNAKNATKEYQQILKFQKYLDSLQLSPTGRKTYDSIAEHRPGLLDSISILENMYHTKQ